MDNLQWLNVALTVVLVSSIVYQGSQIQVKLSETEFDYITSPIASSDDVTEASKKLMEASRSFKNPEIVKVTDRVFVAVGFAIANSIMIEGNDGIIIVDTTEAIESMEEILVEFRKISEKPVKAIVTTHFHPDHIFGIKAIVDEAKKLHPTEDKINIYAHESTEKLFMENYFTAEIASKRAFRQFGVPLAREGTRHSAAIGSFLRFTKTTRSRKPDVTVTVQDRETYKVAGVTFELIHTPGETDDQIAVWFPDDRALLPGDNIYKSFPNLYAIRGSPARDAKIWYQSLDKIRRLNADYLVPSHTRPVIGREAVYDVLLVYRDAIKFVHDQTLRLLNKGFFPDQIVKQVKLPKTLSNHPHLQEHYGTVEWSVRGVFTHYMGWFSGDAKDMYPLDRTEQASKLKELIANARSSDAAELEIILQQSQKCLKRSRDSYERTGRYITTDDQWALELADAALEISEQGSKFAKIATALRISALTSLGVESVSANGRNYYLTMALESAKKWTHKNSPEGRSFTVMNNPIKYILELTCMKVKGESSECQSSNYTVVFELVDLKAKYGMTLRNGVCDVINEDVINENLTYTTTSDTWRSVMAGKTNFKSEMEAGKIKTNDVMLLKEFKLFTDCIDK